MADQTIKELVYKISAVDDGATSTAARVSKSISAGMVSATASVNAISPARQDIAASQAASLNRQQANRLVVSDYRAQYRDTVTNLKKDESGTVARMTATKAETEAADVRAKTSAALVQDYRFSYRETVARLKAEDAAEKHAHDAKMRAERDRERAAVEQSQRSRSSGGAVGAEEGGRVGDSLGRSSALGRTLRALRGGGELYAFAQVAEGLNKVTGKAVELRDEFDKGNVSAGQMADQFSRSIPILGQIYSAGRNIRELFDGEAAAAARITEQANALNLATEARIGLVNSTRDIEVSASQSHASSVREAEIIGKTGPVREIAERDKARDDFAESSATQLEKQQKEIDEDQKLVAARNALQKQVQAKRPDLKYDPIKGFNQKEVEDALGAQTEASAAYFSLAKAAQDKKDALARARNQALADRGANDAKKDAVSREQLHQQIVNEQSTREQELDKRAADVRIQSAELAGNGVTAALAEIERQRAEKVGNIRDKAEQDIKAKRNAGYYDQAIDAVRNQSVREEAIANSEADQKKAEAQHQAQLSRAGVGSQIASARVQSIDAELAAGNRVNEAIKQKIQYEEQYASRRRELNELLRTAEEFQRADIRAELDRLDVSEKINLAAATSRQLEDDRLNLLREQANYGNVAAGAEERRLEAARRYTEEKQRLQGIVDVQKGTPAAEQAKQTLGQLDAVQRARTGKTLEDAAMKMAQSQASGGNQESARLVAKIQAAKEFAGIKAELESVVKDQSSTDAQRAAAEAQLKNLPGLSRQAQNQAGKPKEALPLSSQSEMNRTLRGGRAAITGADRVAKEQIFTLEKQHENAEAKKSNDLLTQILVAIEQGNEERSTITEPPSSPANVPPVKQPTPVAPSLATASPAPVANETPLQKEIRESKIGTLSGYLRQAGHSPEEIADARKQLEALTGATPTKRGESIEQPTAKVATETVGQPKQIERKANGLTVHELANVHAQAIRAQNSLNATRAANGLAAAGSNRQLAMQIAMPAKREVAEKPANSNTAPAWLMPIAAMLVEAIKGISKPDPVHVSGI